MFSCIIIGMKTVIWDFNGTIIDDAALSLQIENEMRHKRGMMKDISLDEYRELFCFPVINYYYKVGYTFENETYEDISVEYNAQYDALFHTCDLMDGFMDKIQESINKGFQNVILSASLHDALIDQCRQLHIDHLFTEILGIDNRLAGSKIDMAKKWMKNAEVKPEDCLYIGDTTHDKETADALGIDHCILVATGHQSYRVLKDVTDHVVHTLKEVEL